MHACLPTFQPTANTGWYQSSFFASLVVLGLVEGIVVILTYVILIFSVFFFLFF